MLNKNDPLIRVVQEVMKKNQAERDAAKLVNEYFGIQDRKVLPHERQGEWNAAYQTVLTEGAKALDEMMIKVNMKHGADHSRLEAKHNVKIVKPEDPKGKHIIQGSKENLRKFADNVYDNYSPVNIHPELYKDEKPLKEASLAGLAPPFEKTTRKDVLVGRGVLKKHPTQPGKHVLAKEDMSPNPTSAPSSQPSATSIRKAATKVKVRMGGNPTSQPNSNRPANAYRKAATKVKVRMGGNPTNAPSSSPSQSGSRPMEEGSDVTSPSGMGIKKPDYATGTPDYAKSKEQTVNRAAKTSLPAGTVAKNIKEEAVSKAQHRFFGLVRGIQKGEARGSANAKKVAASMSPKSVKDYAKTKEKGLPEKVSEAVLGAQIRGQTSYGTNQSPAANLNKPSVIPSGTNKNRADMGNATNGGPFQPAARPAVRPAAGGARPSVIAKNSITRRGMGWTPSGPATNAGVTALNKQTSQQVPNSGSAKPAAAPAPAAAAPAPAAAAPAPAAAKPAAAKVTPVKKQSSAGAAKTQKKLSTAQRAYVARQQDRHGP